MHSSESQLPSGSLSELAVEPARLCARRQFLQRSALGLGSIALASLLGEESAFGAEKGRAENPLGGLPGLPHFAPKAKRVIMLFQSGAPSQVDLFDYKPEVKRREGEELPESVHMNQRLTTMTAGSPRVLLPSIAKFQQRGKSGAWISDFLPHIAGIADEICIVKAMYTEAINHAPAVTFMLTGSQMPGRPSAGAWLAYGLGTANRDLPTFCVLTSNGKDSSCGQLFYDYYWGSGFLPSKYQGVQFRSGGDPVLYLSNPGGVDREMRRGMLDDLGQLNRLKQQAVGDPEIEARVSQYEMAFRMQASVPELVDLSTEPAHILEMYGPDVHRSGSFARNCLLARRLAEKDVRFIQLMHSGWDHHQKLEERLIWQCEDVDQASAALVMDLKQRGLLDETLVIWGGEFGRTVFMQKRKNQSFGRDHHPRNFVIWMAGGGVKKGITFGETDDFSYNIVRDGVHIHDFQATLMHLMGIDHTRLTFKFQGRRFRLTDVHGEVVTPILA